MIAEVVIRVYFDNIEDLKKIETFRSKNPEWSETKTVRFTKFETVKYINDIVEALQNDN